MEYFANMLVIALTLSFFIAAGVGFIVAIL
jgi:hypothetical protein